MNLKLKNSQRVLAILAIGIIVSWLVIISKPTPKPEPPPQLPPHLADVVAVQPGSHAITITSQGTVTPKVEIDITSQISGKIVAVGEHFAAGGFFRAGETLLSIDPEDYEVAVAQAKAVLAEAGKTLAQEQGLARQAKREWRDLGNEQANDLFLRKPQMAAASANVTAAEAGVRQARLNLDRTRISVPFDGRVVSVDANLGQYINAGSRVGSAFASDIMEVRLPLSAPQMALLNLQANARLRELKPLAVSFYLRGGLQVWEWQGKVVRVEAAVDVKSRLFYLVAEIDLHQKIVAASGKRIRQQPILPGIFVEASITSNPHDNVVVLPRSALYQGDQVLILDQDNRLRARQVTVFQVDAEKLVVRGLEDGQQVLVKPPVFMEMGAVYTPVPVVAGAADA